MENKHASDDLTRIDRENDRQRWWSIHDKDTYICPDCGRTQAEHGRQWEVHHIDRTAGNCVALCLSCHKIRHGSSPEVVEVDWWKREFLALGEV